MKPNLLRYKDPDKIFDLLCLQNFLAGQFNNKIPVEENRKVFEHIKKLLNKPKKINFYAQEKN